METNDIQVPTAVAVESATEITDNVDRTFSIISESMEETKIGIPVVEVVQYDENFNYVLPQTDNDTIESTLWVCNDCDLRYKYHTSFLNHMEREHPDKVADVDDEIQVSSLRSQTGDKNKGEEQSRVSTKQWICQICDRNFEYYVSFTEHLNGDHPDVDHEDTDSFDTIKIENYNKISMNDFYVEDPDELSDTQDSVLSAKSHKSLIRQKSSLRTVRKWVCEMCDRTFNYKLSFDKHMTREHPDEDRKDSDHYVVNDKGDDVNGTDYHQDNHASRMEDFEDNTVDAAKPRRKPKSTSIYYPGKKRKKKGKSRQGKDTGRISTKRWICKMCDKSCGYFGVFTNHMRRQHPDMNYYDSDQFVVVEGGVETKISKETNPPDGHVDGHVDNNKASVTEDKGDQSVKQSVKKWVCKICGQSFNHHLPFNNHMKRQHPSENYKNSEHVFAIETGDQEVDHHNHRDKNDSLLAKDSESNPIGRRPDDRTRRRYKNAEKFWERELKRLDLDRVNQEEKEDIESNATGVRKSRRKTPRTDYKLLQDLRYLFVKEPKRSKSRETCDLNESGSQGKKEEEGYKKRHPKPILKEVEKKTQHLPCRTRELVTREIPDDCKKCGKHFENDNHLAEHLRWYHFEAERGTAYIDEEGKLVSKVDVEALHKEIRAKRQKRYLERKQGMKVRNFNCMDCPKKQRKHYQNDWSLAIHRKTMSNVRASQRVLELKKQRTHENGEHTSSKHEASSAMIVNTSKTKKSNSQASKRKKVNDSQEAAVNIEEAQVGNHSLCSSTDVPNNEAIDLSQIHNPRSTACTMISMADAGETDSTEALQQSCSQSHEYQPQHHHNTRQSARIQSLQRTFSAFNPIVSGECLICEEPVNDLRTHYTDVHKVPSDKLQKFLN